MVKLFPNRQSAGVHAPQRINAKDLWYILGLIEGSGSLSCYKEKNLIRVEMVITLKDIKLLYWIKKKLGYGVVKTLKQSNKNVAKYILKEFLKINILSWYDEYPPLTLNKMKRVKYVKDCLETKSILSKNFTYLDSEVNKYSENINEYINDWLIGFIESKGNFYFVERSGKLVAEFNLSQMRDKGLLDFLGKQIGLSLKNKVIIKKSGSCVLTAVSLKDIQAVIDFMYNSDRVRLRGLKKVEFLKWISELRVMARYTGLKIPFRY